MAARDKTKRIQVGDVAIGAGSPVVIQSMLNAPADDFDANLAQLRILEQVGCELVRVAIPHMNSLDTFKEICRRSNVPIVADVHFDPQIALKAIDAGASKLRINPGNIGGTEAIIPILESANKHSIPLRIGVNGGSLDKKLAQKKDCTLPEKLAASAIEYVQFCKDHDFDNIVISAKTSDVIDTIEAYRLISSSLSDIPLHLGVTEAGTLLQGAIKSSLGIGILLHEGIGDTIRVSLTDDPAQEIRSAYIMLKALHLADRGVDIVSCPMCGRCQVDLIGLAKAIEEKLISIKVPLKVAIMGCVVNGPGEARDADIGVACGYGQGVIFKEGKVINKVSEDRIAEELLKEIDGMIHNR